MMENKIDLIIDIKKNGKPVKGDVLVFDREVLLTAKFNSRVSNNPGEWRFVEIKKGKYTIRDIALCTVSCSTKHYCPGKVSFEKIEGWWCVGDSERGVKYDALIRQNNFIRPLDDLIEELL